MFKYLLLIEEINRRNKSKKRIEKMNINQYEGYQHDLGCVLVIISYFEHSL